MLKIIKNFKTGENSTAHWALLNTGACVTVQVTHPKPELVRIWYIWGSIGHYNRIGDGKPRACLPDQSCSLQCAGGSRGAQKGKGPSPSLCNSMGKGGHPGLSVIWISTGSPLQERLPFPGQGGGVLVNFSSEGSLRNWQVYREGRKSPRGLGSPL